MKSVMKHSFSVIPDIKMNRSVFDLSYGFKTTFDGGKLIPFYCEEVLPGDSFNVQSTLFGRLATPLTPFMDNMRLETFYFFVPNRLLWDNWQRFYGEQDDPDDTTDYLVPVLNHTKAPLSTTGFTEMSLFDYFGYPTKVIGKSGLISLPFRAYNLIYKDWFRDQNLMESPEINKGDGPDDPADYSVQNICKRRDYFTTALPWAQKPYAGIQEVTLPLGDLAPLKSLAPFDSSITVTSGNDSNHHVLKLNGSSNLSVNVATGAETSQIYADLSDATASTINQLRQAFQIQHLLEQMARGGSRYIERLRVEFQVVSPDGRLQRPEYLGGGVTPISTHPVVQTSQSDTTPQGTLTATGVVASSNNGFVKSFVEHGWLIGLCAVRCDLNYVQGIERKFTRRTAFDYYRPALAHLGEQAILNQEIYCNASSHDTEAFGYIPRYDEYRHAFSKITGLFRFNATGTLETWHLAQEFSSLPVLNEDFIKENAPIDRVIAVPSQPHFLLDVMNTVRAARPLPTYAVPGLIDHF